MFLSPYLVPCKFTAPNKILHPDPSVQTAKVDLQFVMPDGNGKSYLMIGKPAQRVEVLNKHRVYATIKKSTNQK